MCIHADPPVLRRINPAIRSWFCYAPLGSADDDWRPLTAAAPRVSVTPCPMLQVTLRLTTVERGFMIEFLSPVPEHH